MRNVSLLLLIALAGLGLLGAAPSPRSGPGGPIDAGDTAWMLTAAGLVLLMTPGLSFFYGGMVRPKNVLSTMLQSFIAMGVVSVLWVLVGFSLVFGDSLFGVVGDPRTFFLFRGVGAGSHPVLSPTIPFVLFAVFQLKFAIITPALVSGSFAERVRFSSYTVFIALFTLFIYCPLAHATWHPDGLLHRWGILDFAGGTVVHMSAGIAALAGAVVLGPRKDHQRGQAHLPAEVTYVMLGTGLLWFGWFGFNAGSALTASSLAAHAFATTHMASAAAMLAWLAFDRLRGRKPSALGACIGAVVGLVAITPAAGYVTIGASLFIGVSSSVVSNLVAWWKSTSQLDDTLDVFPCHGVGGMFGMICTGVFASKVVNPSGADGLWFGGSVLFVRHLAALVAVAAIVFLLSYLLYRLTDRLSPLRVAESEERLGLDLSQHGESLRSHDDGAVSAAAA